MPSVPKYLKDLHAPYACQLCGIDTHNQSGICRGCQPPLKTGLGRWLRTVNERGFKGADDHITRVDRLRAKQDEARAILKAHGLHFGSPDIECDETLRLHYIGEAFESVHKRLDKK